MKSISATIPNLFTLAARYYDMDLPRASYKDLPFYLNYAKLVRGDILELACGTGRISLPLVKAGHCVCGVDLSNAMLDVFRKKLAAEPLIVRQRIQLVCADMAEFHLDRSFELILIPFRGFQHLTLDSDQRRCLRCIREHLVPGGRLIFDIMRLSRPLDASWLHPELIQLEFDDPESGDHIVKKHRGCKIDLQHQIIYPEFIFEITSPDGSHKTLIEPLSLKIFDKQELCTLLHEEGFQVITSSGEGNELMLICAPYS